MKRRDFIQKASFAAGAAPFAALSLLRSPVTEPIEIVSEPAVEPCLSGKVSFDGNWIGFTFTDVDHQTAFIKNHFSQASKWEEWAYGQWQPRPRQITVETHPYHPSTKITMTPGSYGANSTIMFVAVGSYITPIGNELHIIHRDSVGDSLNWRFRPQTSAFSIMGVDQVYPGGLEYTYSLSPYEAARSGKPHWGEGSCDWEQLPNLMREHQIEMCGIDMYPEASAARRFQQKFRGHVTLISYASQRTHTGVHSTLWRHLNDSDIVYADRDAWYYGSHPATFRDIAHVVLEERRASELAFNPPYRKRLR